jgi:hypothetical protein
VYFSSALGGLLALLSLNTRDTESPGLFSEYTLSSSFALNGTVYSLVKPFSEVFFCILPSGSFGSDHLNKPSKRPILFALSSKTGRLFGKLNFVPSVVTDAIKYVQGKMD